MTTRSKVAQVFADEWPVVVAALTRDLGDLGQAEEAAQEAFVEAAARWGPTSTPDRPGAWLITTARRKAIDRLRRDRRFTDRLPALMELGEAEPRPATDLVDEQLALIFGCCHPSLAPEARIALTLREVCGLSTAQIAESFLVPLATMAKRLVRAKDKIRRAGVPFAVPARAQLPGRIEDVLGIVYLIFTAGHSAADGPSLVRGDLCDEARWLASVLARLLTGLGPFPHSAVSSDVTTGRGPQPAQRRASVDHDLAVAVAETLGLHALMLITDARRAARVDGRGHLVLLEDQDRSCWDDTMLAEGQSLLARALAIGHVGPYQLQAAIAGVHATAVSVDTTDWPVIIALYDRLAVLAPSPVVDLNRAVAVAMADGPQAGLDLIDELTSDGSLDQYRYLHAARADLLRRLGDRGAAAAAYRRAMELGGNEAEQRFLADRLDELDN